MELDLELCPHCLGQSPPVAVIDAQFTALGDISGVCGLCGNTHEVSREVYDHYMKEEGK